MKTTKSKDGTTLAYDVYGNGPPLIFVTGATCFRQFEPVLQDAKVFAEQFTVYNYDRRGRGDSTNTLPFSIEREMEDMEAMIDAAGGKANLYGHSSGAILALEAGMRFGSKVSKLALYDPAYAHNQADLNEFEELSQELYTLLDRGKNDEALSHFLEGIGTPKEVIDGMFRQSPQWAAMVALAPTLAYDIMLASNLPPIADASRLTIPTHIMVGEESPASMHEVVKQLNDAIPHAEYSTLPGQDHMPDPNVVLQILTSFFKQ
ncbi:alpha/beta hydrolase [Radiobacillus kanasensis]|uniref:alpha/beta fold hydrolase n=1 Tax=Radiobacillus kanasensis TaxID=2844358 RepID=UPI001E3B2854|nr:alpha/beta hydrolase [Radiobacillus kanasensis]UFT99531.1 alpha/beta hydrolase [Radiobacillus kanasensis]